MGKILSDVSKRVLIVQGIDEVVRIQNIAYEDYIKYGLRRVVETTNIQNDVWKIELIELVGDYYPLKRV